MVERRRKAWKVDVIALSKLSDNLLVEAYVEAYYEAVNRKLNAEFIEILYTDLREEGLGKSR